MDQPSDDLRRQMLSRRAADELLIDAIFGRTHELDRHDDPLAPAPHLSAARDLAGVAAPAQPFCKAR